MADPLRFSRRVPDSGVNLAWIQLPELDPTANLSLVETARLIAENLSLTWTEAAPSGVVGVTDSSTGTDRQLFYTNYNTLPAVGASGTIAAGAASYAIPRTMVNAVSPSGFVIENCAAPIRVFPPRPDETGVWRARVQDGVVLVRYTMRAGDKSWLSQVYTPGDQLVLYYSVPETITTPFALENPDYEDGRVVEVSGVAALITGDRELALPDGDLVSVFSLTVNGQEQITGASGQIGSTQLPPVGPFTAWDPLKGTLSLSRSLAEEDEVRVSYRYREALYLYEGYRDDTGLYHDLNLSPAPGHTYDGGRPTGELLNVPIYLYLVPSAAYRRVDSGGNVEQTRQIYTYERFTSAVLRWERTAAPVADRSNPPAIDATRTRSTYGHAYFGSANLMSQLPVDNLVAGTAATGQTLVNMPSALILAKIYVTGATPVDAVRILDTRVKGGGIPETVDPADAALPGATRQEAESYWDAGGWDGQPVPLAGVLLVELPKGLLTGTGGYTQFSADEIETIVNAHVAAGVQVVVKYV